MHFIHEVVKTRAADDEYKYMLLSRMLADCKFFLGHGGRNERVLWAGNVRAQHHCMRYLWNSFEEKPQWLSLEEINDYYQRMKTP